MNFYASGATQGHTDPKIISKRRQRRGPGSYHALVCSPRLLFRGMLQRFDILDVDVPAPERGAAGVRIRSLRGYRGTVRKPRTEQEASWREFVCST